MERVTCSLTEQLHQSIERVREAAACTGRALRQRRRIRRGAPDIRRGVNDAPRIDGRFGIDLSRQQATGSACGGPNAFSASEIIARTKKQSE